MNVGLKISEAASEVMSEHEARMAVHGAIDFWKERGVYNDALFGSGKCSVEFHWDTKRRKLVEADGVKMVAVALVSNLPGEGNIIYLMCAHEGIKVDQVGLAEGHHRLYDKRR